MRWLPLILLACTSKTDTDTDIDTEQGTSVDTEVDTDAPALTGTITVELQGDVADGAIHYADAAGAFVGVVTTTEGRATIDDFVDGGSVTHVVSEDPVALVTVFDVPLGSTLLLGDSPGPERDRVSLEVTVAAPASGGEPDGGALLAAEASESDLTFPATVTLNDVAIDPSDSTVGVIGFQFSDAGPQWATTVVDATSPTTGPIPVTLNSWSEATANASVVYTSVGATEIQHRAYAKVRETGWTAGISSFRSVGDGEQVTLSAALPPSGLDAVVVRLTQDRDGVSARTTLVVDPPTPGADIEVSVSSDRFLSLGAGTGFSVDNGIPTYTYAPGDSDCVDGDLFLVGNWSGDNAAGNDHTWRFVSTARTVSLPDLGPDAATLWPAGLTETGARTTHMQVDETAWTDVLASTELLRITSAFAGFASTASCTVSDTAP